MSALCLSATPSLDVRELHRVCPQAEDHNTRDSISGVGGVPPLPDVSHDQVLPKQQQDNTALGEPKCP